jgi:hypothetical protein
MKLKLLSDPFHQDGVIAGSGSPMPEYNLIKVIKLEQQVLITNSSMK